MPKSRRVLLQGSSFLFKPGEGGSLTREIPIKNEPPTKMGQMRDWGLMEKAKTIMDPDLKEMYPQDFQKRKRQGVAKTLMAK